MTRQTAHDRARRFETRRFLASATLTIPTHRTPCRTERACQRLSAPLPVTTDTITRGPLLRDNLPTAHIGERAQASARKPYLSSRDRARLERGRRRARAGSFASRDGGDGDRARRARVPSSLVASGTSQRRRAAPRAGADRDRARIATRDASRARRPRRARPTTGGAFAPPLPSRTPRPPRRPPAILDWHPPQFFRRLTPRAPPVQAMVSWEDSKSPKPGDLDGIGADKFVEFFRQASPYIVNHHGSVMVVVIPGEVFVAKDILQGIVQDVALLQSLGVRVVLVLGSNKQVEEGLVDRGIVSEVVDGYRVTTPEALEVAMEAAGRNSVLTQALLSRGINVAVTRRHGDRGNEEEERGGGGGGGSSGSFFGRGSFPLARARAPPPASPATSSRLSEGAWSRGSTFSTPATSSAWTSTPFARDWRWATSCCSRPWGSTPRARC